MINTIFHFVNDPTFDYAAAIENGDISEYTIVLNSADHSIYCKGTTFGRMERSDIADLLGDISDILPVATEDKIGGVKIGYTSNTDANNRKYAVKLDTNKRAYVEVPWSDTITPVFDDSLLRQTINNERERVDALIQNIGNIVDQKNRQLYADGDWVREIFGNVQDPESMAAAYRKELDDYLQAFDVWEYIDPEHPELGRRARISEFQNTVDGLTHRMGEAEVGISGTQVKVSTLKHDVDGLTSTVTNISDDLDTVTRKESAIEQTVDSIDLRVTASEGNISNLQTQEASLQIQADKILSRVVATENSINGCYKATIVQNPSDASSAISIDTISAVIAEKDSITNNLLFNDEDFTTAPTIDLLYKNSVPQYFTFSRYQGLTVRASSLEQTADSITARVGVVEGNLNDPTTGLITRTSTVEQTASSLSARVGAVETKADNTKTALANFELSVDSLIDGIKQSHTNLSNSVSTYETTNDGNIGNLIKMAAAVLDLKSSEDAEGNLSTTTDLANAITNGSFTGYSGLSQRVSQTESGISANAKLIADVQGTVNGLDVDGAVTRATAGLASETWVGQNYDTKGSASSAESNAKGYADSIVAGAKASLLASVDEVCAGIGVTVTKDANGNYSSVTQIDADDIYLNGKTWAQYIGVGLIVADTLTAGTATIDAATINSATITGTLSGVDGTFSGTLSAATGSFSGTVFANTGSFKGNVTADQFLAGDEGGLNITVTGDAVSFNYGSDQRAWFTTKKADGTQSDGMYLYIKNPDLNATNKLITIDFTNLKFEPVGVSGQSAIQQKDVYETITGSNVQHKPNVFKGSADDLYYSNSDLAGNHLYTSSVTTYQYVKERYVVINYNSATRLYKAKIYKQVSFSAGVKTDTSNYYAILYDTYGSVLDGTEMKGTTESTKSTYDSPDSTILMGSSSLSVNSISYGHIRFSKTNGNFEAYDGSTVGTNGGKVSLFEMIPVGSGADTDIVETEVLTLHS